MVELRPLRTVTGSWLAEVRGSLLGGDTSRRVRMWRLDLDCGHKVMRFCRYPARPDRARANGWHPRPITDVLPAPKRARCDQCPPQEVAQRSDTSTAREA